MLPHFISPWFTLLCGIHAHAILRILRQDLGHKVPSGFPIHHEQIASEPRLRTPGLCFTKVGIAYYTIYKSARRGASDTHEKRHYDHSESAWKYFSSGKQDN
ncbi:uncharacterized protein F5Z01DRAFT_259436 [Emericellopsis atlantica]|uniref:Secreted protein n=1 Tax=Emericellopsis atlantica TaxID=2614577 RepID=A0A9P7ZH20_9HYPO|nr:uncharacterized protein F5Z01DRAFT_259436 [Emericellopsis atlantica]KAG9251974.1 hypothetical protein F5Z01DRAFT_259436 [Emericellopsis atlantica]